MYKTQVFKVISRLKAKIANSAQHLVERKISASESKEEPCFYSSGWGTQERGVFNRESKAYIFRSIMSFFSTHQISGDYFEFGCFGAYTMRMAWDHTKVLCEGMDYFAFDSFQGFPEVEDVDEGHWKQGDLCMSEVDFRGKCISHGLPESRLHTIPGFFNSSLISVDTIKRLRGRKASIIYVDVDTYTPTTEILNFIIPYLQRGTVIVFDDWNCFFADDNLGERRAWKEFVSSNRQLKFTPFVSTHLAQTFIFLGFAE